MADTKYVAAPASYTAVAASDTVGTRFSSAQWSHMEGKWSVAAPVSPNKAPAVSVGREDISSVVDPASRTAVAASVDTVGITSIAGPASNKASAVLADTVDTRSS